MKLHALIVVGCCFTMQVFGMDKIFTSRSKVSDGQAQEEIETIKKIEETVVFLKQSARIRTDSSESIEYLSQLVSNAEKSPKIKHRVLELVGNLDEDFQKIVRERVDVYTGLHNMESSTRKHMKSSKITSDQAAEMINIYRNMHNISPDKKS